MPRKVVRESWQCEVCGAEFFGEGAEEKARKCEAQTNEEFLIGRYVWIKDHPIECYRYKTGRIVEILYQRRTHKQLFYFIKVFPNDRGNDFPDTIGIVRKQFELVAIIRRQEAVLGEVS